MLGDTLWYCMSKVRSGIEVCEVCSWNEFQGIHGLVLVYCALKALFTTRLIHPIIHTFIQAVFLSMSALSVIHSRSALWMHRGQLAHGSFDIQTGGAVKQTIDLEMTPSEPQVGLGFALSPILFTG